MEKQIDWGLIVKCAKNFKSKYAIRKISLKKVFLGGILMLDFDISKICLKENNKKKTTYGRHWILQWCANALIQCPFPTESFCNQLLWPTTFIKVVQHKTYLKQTLQLKDLIRLGADAVKNCQCLVRRPWEYWPLQRPHHV